MHEWFYGGFWFLGWIICMMIFFSVMSRLWWSRGWRRRWYDEHYADKDPLTYAKERYAKGEITKEEYDKIKKDLTE
jgi:putative membrane protein